MVYYVIYIYHLLGPIRFQYLLQLRSKVIHVIGTQINLEDYLEIPTIYQDFVDTLAVVHTEFCLGGNMRAE